MSNKIVEISSYAPGEVSSNLEGLFDMVDSMKETGELDICFEVTEDGQYRISITMEPESMMKYLDTCESVREALKKGEQND